MNPRRVQSTAVVVGPGAPRMPREASTRRAGPSTYVGHARPRNNTDRHLCLPGPAGCRLAQSGRRTVCAADPGHGGEPCLRAFPITVVPRMVQQFFTEYLVRQRPTSPYMVAAYRDATVLFLASPPASGQGTAALSLQDFTPAVILAFLHHLEQRATIRCKTAISTGGDAGLPVPSTPRFHVHAIDGRWGCR